MEKNKDLIFDNESCDKERLFTITETQVEKIYNQLLKLEANVNNGLLSPNDTAKQIHLINELFCDLTKTNK